MPGLSFLKDRKKIRQACLVIFLVIIFGWLLTADCLSSRPLPGFTTQQDKQDGNLRTGTVTAVYDGDTIRVQFADRKELRVRLIGVDSPEANDERETVRLLAFLAKRFAHFRLHQKKVRLTAGPEQADKFGRLLAFVWTEDGEMFNETVIAEGYAFAYLRYPFDPGLEKRLKAAEAKARRAGKGLWNKDPFVAVQPEEVKAFVGRLVRVRFKCGRSFERGRFRIVQPVAGNFELAIPRTVFYKLSGNLNYKGRTLEVIGFVELFRHVPQIMIGLAEQLKVVR